VIGGRGEHTGVSMSFKVVSKAAVSCETPGSPSDYSGENTNDNC
jgi:hypothetical protein